MTTDEFSKAAYALLAEAGDLLLSEAGESARVNRWCAVADGLRAQYRDSAQVGAPVAAPRAEAQLASSAKASPPAVSTPAGGTTDQRPPGPPPLLTSEQSDGAKEMASGGPGAGGQVQPVPASATCKYCLWWQPSNNGKLCVKCGKVFGGNIGTQGEPTAAPEGQQGVPLCLELVDRRPGTNCTLRRGHDGKHGFAQQARCAAFVHGPELGLDGCDFAAEGNVECAPGQCAAGNLAEGQQGEATYECPRWCGWEYPGHVNDPKPPKGTGFITYTFAGIHRAFCGEPKCALARHQRLASDPAAPAKASEPGRPPLSEQMRGLFTLNTTLDEVQQRVIISRVAAIEAELAEAKGRLREMTRSASDAMDEATAARVEVEQLRAKLEEDRRDRWTLVEAAQDARHEIAALEAELAGANGASYRWASEAASRASAHVDAVAERDAARADYQRERNNYDDALAKLEAARAEVEELRAKLGSMSNTVLQQTNVIAHQGMDVADANAREAAMRAACAKVARSWSTEARVGHAHANMIAEAIERLPLSTGDEKQRSTHHVLVEPFVDYGPGRCEVCGWTLTETPEQGCVAGDCSFRPDAPLERQKLSERRRQLAERRGREAQPDAIKAAVTAANNRAADAFHAWTSDIHERTSLGRMTWDEFEAWLRSGAPAAGTVKP